MSKKRDTDLKYNNRGNFEQKGPAQVSRSTVEHRDIPNESTESTNPMSQDMVKSREQAIRTNDKK